MELAAFPHLDPAIYWLALIAFLLYLIDVFGWWYMRRWQKRMDTRMLRRIKRK